MTTIIPLTGSAMERIMTCLHAAGWYEGRQVDLTDIKAFYAAGGITLPAGAEAFLREYYGIAEAWHLQETSDDLRDQTLANWSPEITFSLIPDRMLSDAEDMRFQWSSVCKPQAEEAAGEPLVKVGLIGDYYPAPVFLGSTHKIYTVPSDDSVHCYDSVPEMLEHCFLDVHKQVKLWNYAAMQFICYQRGDPRNVLI